MTRERFKCLDGLLERMEVALKKYPEAVLLSIKELPPIIDSMSVHSDSYVNRVINDVHTELVMSVCKEALKKWI